MPVPFDNQHTPPEERRLEEFFAAYRAATPDPEPSANFMPGLWQRIEARQSVRNGFWRLAPAFATASAAICVILGLFLVSPRDGGSVSGRTSYIEILAQEHAGDMPELAEAIFMEAEQENRIQ
jgi:anti-sigma-K factor RskA